jgi:hypothetical protein
MPDGSDPRVAFLAWLRDQLIGPIGGPHELLNEPPTQRYLMGTLFPQATDADVALEDDEADEQGGEIGEEVADDRVTLHNEHMPSAVGLSFVTGPTTAISVEIAGARYVKGTEGWTRVPFGAAGTVAEKLAKPEGARRAARRILDGAAELYSVWRPHGDGHLVTVALINTARQEDKTKPPDPASCLFQVGLSCRPSEGSVLRYPSPDRISPDPEAQELALLYRRTPTYAIGHGCATQWEVGDGGAKSVGTEFLPVEKVPDVVFDVAGFDRVTDLNFLARTADRAGEVIAELDRFVEAYASWVGAVETNNGDVPQYLDAARERIVARLRTAHIRMERGVRLLEASAEARRAFSLANEAMLMQIVHSQSDDYGATRHTRNERPFVVPDYASAAARWRPFQLAFLLLTLESATSENDEARDVVDLIWFPTGGGKTEAYLAIVAYVIFHRRERLGDRGWGTTVITRYTMRLLTSQQFRRAAALVCACELVRRREAATMGNIPISIGIWLGNDSSPGTYADARKLLEELKDGETPSKSFQLELCPWCGTELLPTEDLENPENWGITVDNASLGMFCPSDDCPFHLALPATSVDEDIYAHPPTVLIGTIDKFARLAWDPRSGVLIGAGPTAGPSLTPGRAAPHLGASRDHHRSVRGSVRYRHELPRMPTQDHRFHGHDPTGGTADPRTIRS